jgi:solute carrier family 10 (sodium/bile acid cotransporter), member 7
VTSRPRGALLRFAPDRFTLLLVAVVAVAAFAPPAAAYEGAMRIAIEAVIALMFFLYGARLATSAVLAGLAHWRLHALVLGATFVMFPLLGAALGRLPASVLPPPLALGLMFLCLLPSTLQSSLAFTSIAGGNVAAAMCAATLSSLVGTALTPLLAALLVSSRGMAPLGGAIGEIATLLLAPFLAGQALRPWIGGAVARMRGVLGAVDRGSILLVVYAAFGHSARAGVWRALPTQAFVALFALEALTLGIALLATSWSARSLGFNRADRIAIVFCGSKKSLAAGVPMAGVLFPGPDLGLILLPAMLFHQMQLMVCAALARRWAAETEGGAQPAEGAAS